MNMAYFQNDFEKIKGKRTNILIVRFIAAFFVIILHNRWPLHTNKIAFTFLGTLCLPAVNLFIMCTAAQSFSKTQNN